MERQLERVTYTIYPEQRAVLRQIAKEHGTTSESAALRYIINDWFDSWVEAQRGNGKDTDNE